MFIFWDGSMNVIFRPTRLTQWGAFPNYQETHDPDHEEFVHNERFNILR